VFLSALAVEPVVGLLGLTAGFSPFQGGYKVPLVWESLLFGFGKFVVEVYAAIAMGDVERPRL
jgi:hypothetical protein